MEKLDIEAVYEGGTLKLARPLPLQDGEKVTITIQFSRTPGKRLVGLVPWHGSQEDLDLLISSDDNDPLEAP